MPWNKSVNSFRNSSCLSSNPWNCMYHQYHNSHEASCIFPHKVPFPVSQLRARNRQSKIFSGIPGFEALADLLAWHQHIRQHNNTLLPESPQVPSCVSIWTAARPVPCVLCSLHLHNLSSPPQDPRLPSPGRHIQQGGMLQNVQTSCG